MKFVRISIQGKFSARLLQGVTGSGKTEVYCQAMEKVLEKGGGVLFLVPEVALAPQTVDRLRARFGKQGEQVVVWHSHLSAGERLDAWRRLVKGEARIVVGARSAVLLLFKIYAWLWWMKNMNWLTSRRILPVIMDGM